MTRSRRVAVFVAFVAVAGVMAIGAPADAQEFRLGHFKCYVAESAPIDAIVGTQDQFDIPDKTGFEPTDVKHLMRLCNPVEKIHRRRVSPIPDRRAHLTLYLAVPPNITATRRVLVANQFGRQKLLTYNPVGLATPTSKNNEGFPEELDHYKCYRAYGNPVNAVVTLRDQFEVQQGLKVGRPLLFCNPSRKTHAGATYGVRNADDHLVCYQLERRPFERGAFTVDQFGAHDLRVKEADMLCTPTKKLEWTRIQ